MWQTLISLITQEAFLILDDTFMHLHIMNSVIVCVQVVLTSLKGLQEKGKNISNRFVNTSCTHTTSHHQFDLTLFPSYD